MYNPRFKYNPNKLVAENFDDCKKAYPSFSDEIINVIVLSAKDGSEAGRQFQRVRITEKLRSHLDTLLL